jgi:hypothetical protein
VAHHTGSLMMPWFSTKMSACKDHNSNTLCLPLRASFHQMRPSSRRPVPTEIILIRPNNKAGNTSLQSSVTRAVSGSHFSRKPQKTAIPLRGINLPCGGAANIPLHGDRNIVPLGEGNDENGASKKC